MQKIELKYKSENISANHKYLKYTGFLWLIIGTTQIVLDDKLGYFSLILGIAHFFFLNKKQSDVFASITNGIFQRNHWFASQTDLTKAKYVKKFAGDVTFVFNNKEIRIEAMFLDETSQEDLDSFIASCKIPTKIIPVQ